MFDFDVHDIEQQYNEFVGCGYIQRKRDDIRLQLPGLAADDERRCEELSNCSDPIENLVSICYKHGKYWLFHNRSIESDSYKHHLKMAWFIVRYNQDKYDPKYDNQMYIEVGDVIKFGRVRFRVRRLVLENDGETDQNVDYYELGGEDYKMDVQGSVNSSFADQDIMAGEVEESAQPRE